MTNYSLLPLRYSLDTIFFRIQEEGNVPDTNVDDHPSMAKAREFLLLLALPSTGTSLR